MTRVRALWLLVIVLLAVPVIALAAADISTSRDTVAFGSRCVHFTGGETKAVTIRNEGNRNALDVRVMVSPTAFAPVFPLSGATSIPTLEPGEAAKFHVGFVAGKEGSQSAHARIQYSSQPAASASPTPAGPTRSVSLSGTGIDRFLDLSPRGLNFGDLRLGQRGQEQRVTVYDDGDSALTITSIAITGRNAGEFTVSPRGSRTITQGSPLRLRVGFTPRGVGARRATLEVRSDGCDEPTKTVDLVGVGVVQDIVALPGRMDFDAADLGDRDTRRITIANQGGADLRVTAVSLSGLDAEHFRIPLVPALPRTLRPGESFDIRVRFVADTPGLWRARVDIESNDPDSETLGVKMTGTTLAPETTATPTPSGDPGELPSPTISPQAPAGEGNLGAYAEEFAVLMGVASFFLLLVLARRIRGIPE